MHGALEKEFKTFVSGMRLVTTPSVTVWPVRSLDDVLGLVSWAMWDMGEACFLSMKACLLEMTGQDHLQTVFRNLQQGLIDLTRGPSNINTPLFYKRICTMPPKVL